MGIHKEGFKIIRNVSLGLLVLNLFVCFLFNPWVFYCFLLLSLLTFFFVLYFFRKPSRSMVVNEEQIFSPADGTIVAIEEIDEI